MRRYFAFRHQRMWRHQHVRRARYMQEHYRKLHVHVHGWIQRRRIHVWRFVRIASNLNITVKCRHKVIHAICKGLRYLCDRSLFDANEKKRCVAYCECFIAKLHAFDTHMRHILLDYMITSKVRGHLSKVWLIRVRDEYTFILNELFCHNTVLMFNVISYRYNNPPLPSFIPIQRPYYYRSSYINLKMIVFL